LLAEISDLEWAGGQRVEIMRDAIIGEMVLAMKNFEPEKLRQIRRFIEIENRASGCGTPAETLICGLVRRYEYGIAPQDLERELHRTYTDGFRLNFEEALDEASHSRKCTRD
jgi:hypothetical protein